MRRVSAAALFLFAVTTLGLRVASACTGFCAVGKDGHVLVGNNEDWFNPRSKLWFVPAKQGAYGRLYVGFDDMNPFGGMNERGLWFDGFAAPPLRATRSADLPSYPGNIVDAAMAQCATVEEVVTLFSRYNRSFLAEAILMFADASGDAVSIEANAIVRKRPERGHFVQTNFHQSRGSDGGGYDRYQTASAMLERAAGDISLDLFRRILSATHQEGSGPTQYSNVYDLTSRTMYLYYFHDYERVATFRLAEELKKGERVIDIPSLFPANAAAQTFAARAAPSPRGSQWQTLAVLGVLLGAVAIALVRGGRRTRIAFASAGAAVAILAIAVVTSLSIGEHGARSPIWITFSLAPASGDTLSSNPTMLRGSGATLRALIGKAFDFPTARVSGPEWLSQTRIAIDATVGLGDEQEFRALLREELERHLRLETHVESRSVDVFVLRASAAPRLERGVKDGPSIAISRNDVLIRNASMPLIASGFQSILGKPVIDDTRLGETYNMQLDWQGDPVASLTGTLRDRFGLELTPARREMQVLLVDRASRDAALFLAAEAGRLTRFSPAFLRKPLTAALRIH